jgi:hypothetical protein
MNTVLHVSQHFNKKKFRKILTAELSFQTAAKCFGKQNVSLFQGKVNTVVGRQCINIAAKQSKTRTSECNRGQLESWELIHMHINRPDRP